MSEEQKRVSFRSVFAKMDPRSHDKDPALSEVLAHIMETMGCDMDRALSAFNSMRNRNSGVLVFDHIERKWHGCDWTLPDAEAEKVRIQRELNAMKRELAQIKSEFRKLKKRVGRGGRRCEETEDEEQSQEPQAQPEPTKVDKPFEEKTVGELTDEEFRAVLRQGIRLQVVEDEDPDEP